MINETDTSGLSLGGTVSVDKLVFVEPSHPARRLFWHLYSIGSRRIVREDRHEAFEKPGAHLFWVQSGEGLVECESKQYELRPSAKVWFADMGKPRTYIPVHGGHLTIVGFRFSGPGLEFWHEEICRDGNSEFRIGNYGIFKKAYRELLRLTQRTPIGWEWRVHLLLDNLMGELLLSKGYFNNLRDEVPASVTRVLDTISRDPCRNWKARELAEVARISYSGLRALFQRVGKGTIHDHIREMRFKQAQLFLIESKMSVKDIADKLHFSSEFYFSHFFRRCAGVSPTKFREGLKH